MIFKQCHAQFEVSKMVTMLIILAVYLHLNTSRAIVPQFISFASMINNNKIEIETAQLFVVKQIEKVKLFRSL